MSRTSAAEALMIQPDEVESSGAMVERHVHSEEPRTPLHQSEPTPEAEATAAAAALHLLDPQRRSLGPGMVTAGPPPSAFTGAAGREPQAARESKVGSAPDSRLRSSAADASGPGSCHG